MDDWFKKALEEQKETIMECLDEARIVSFELTENGLEIVESCDVYFGRTLNASQVDRLIEELKSLRKKMG